MKITSRYMSTNGELILKTMLSGCKLLGNQTWSYNDSYNVDDCSVVFINIDEAEGKQLWQQLGVTDLSLVKIAYTAIPESYPYNSQVLRKPIRFKELHQLIGNLEVLIEKYKDANNIININPIPAKTTSCVLEAIIKDNRNKIIRLRTGTETIIIDCDRLLFSASISDKEIESLLISDFSSCEINILSDKAGFGDLSRDLSGPLSRAISQCFNQKLLSSLNQQDYFKLTRWPNFKRIRYNSAYVQIAVLLNKKFHDIASISQTCKVSFEDIITFINICYALRNLEVQTTGQPVMVNEFRSEKRKNVPFLAKIRTRLGI
jgi:hypothetical protein